MNRLATLFSILFLCLLASFAAFASATSTPTITIYVAKKIITMDPEQPDATAVAVKDNRIYSVGALNDMLTWMKPGSYTINNQFQNDVITPGLIEAHAHFDMLSVFMSHPYVGYWDFPGMNGTVLPAAKSKQAVIENLKKAEKAMKDPNEILFAWGYDPIYFNNENLTRDDLDAISKTRPIFVLNASEHIGYVNSLILAKVGYNEKTTIAGVDKGDDGKPNGVLEEATAMMPALFSYYAQLFSAETFKTNLYGTADTAHRLGLTTVAELLYGGPGEEVMTATLKDAANDAKFPVRIVNVYNGLLLGAMDQKTPGAGLTYLENLEKQNSNKLRFGAVKFISDGSIQGFTSRIKWPGYFNGAPDGLWNTTTDQMKAIALPYWQAGHAIHVHVNGDEATDSALDVLSYLQTKSPRKNVIFVLEHDQMSTPEQFKRARALGASVNLFANHIYYWGDQHYAITLGPDRANRMDAAAEAKRQGLIFSLHTDSPVTPLGPLHSMWSAMNRTTATGRVLGADQKISAEDALKAVTLNAAYLLDLQNEVGSIAIGKRADFTVLARDPLTEPVTSVKDIPVVATIQDGNVYLVK